MKKIVKPHKARKPSASTDVPSFARGKDQILKSSTRLQKRKRNELGEFDDGKNLEFREVPKWQYVDDGSGNMNIVDTNTGQTGTFALPELEIVGNKPTIWDKVKNWFTNATIGAAMAEDPSVMTASGWKQNSNGDWIQSPDEGSKQLADNLAVISSFSPTNYATAVGDALISKVGYPLYQLVKNKQLLPYIKSYLTHPTWQTYYHGSPISFNVNEAKMGTPADMGLHVTRNKDVTNNFGGVSYKMRAPRPKVTTSDLWQNGMEHLRKDHVFFKPSAYSYTDFNIADKQLLDDLNKSGIEFKLENPHYIGSPNYRRLTGVIGQEFRINPRSRFEKAIPKSKRTQFNEEADKLVNIPNNIDLDSPAESLRKSAINEASAKLLDKYGLTTVKYFNRNPYEGALPAYWINNPNKIDVLYNYNTMNTIHGLSSPITTIATDQSLYDNGKDKNKSVVYYDSSTGEYSSDLSPKLTVLNRIGDDPTQWTYTDDKGRLYTPTQTQVNSGEIKQGKDPSAMDRFLSWSNRHYNDPILGAAARYANTVKNNQDPITGVASFMPGIGETIDVLSAASDFLSGNYKQAAIGGALSLLPFVPYSKVRNLVNSFGSNVIVPAMMRFSGNNQNRISDTAQMFANDRFRNDILNLSGDNYYRSHNGTFKNNGTSKRFISYGGVYPGFEGYGDWHLSGRIKTPGKHVYEIPKDAIGDLPAVNDSGQRADGMIGDYNNPFGNQAVIHDIKLSEAIKNSPHTEYVQTPAGTQRILHLGKPQRNRNDVDKGDYANAGIGLGLLALPNFIEKPLRGIKKGVKRGKDQIWLAKTLNNFGTGLRNPWIRDKWKMYRRNPSLVRDYDKYVANWYNLDLNQMKESLPQLQQFNTDFPGLKKIQSDYGYSIDPNLFLQQASKTLNRAKYYAGGYHRLMNKIKSNNSTLYNIAKESPQYAQQIYNDLINNRIGNTEDYVKSLIDQSNTFMRGMKKVDPKTNPQAYLTIAGRSMGSATPAMDVGSPEIVLGGDYGTPVIYKPKNRQLTGSVDTWWSQRTPNFKDESITITPASMWTGNAKQSAHLIPGGFKNNNAVSLERILNDYLYHSGNVDIPVAYGRSASHMTFWSPNKGASIADQFDIIPASDVDLNTIKFGLGYRKGKDDHRYYDYIIAQSMLGNPTAKRMTGEDDRYIPAFGQGDRSNIVLGSYGNYATPSVMNVGGELMYIPNPWAVFPEWMVQNQSFRFNNPNDAIDFAENYKYSSPAFPEFFGVDNSINYNKGKDSGIHIKKANRGKFTAAAKRAGMGVQAYARKILSAPKGKYSATLRKRANFARNASKFKH